MSFWTWRESFDRWISVPDLPIKETVKDCPRCHKCHEDLEFFEFHGHIEAGLFETFTHFGFCPTLGQPIMLGICDFRPLIHPQRTKR
jgi:hypothetical protein